MIQTRQQQIEDRLKRIELEGKNPNITAGRREILRKFYKFWKRELEETNPDLMAIKTLFSTENEQKPLEN